MDEPVRVDPTPAAALARLDAEFTAERRSVRRWATRRERHLEATYQKERARLRRDVAAQALIAARAAHTDPTTDPVAFVLQNYDIRIRAMRDAGYVLNLPRLARWCPWAEWQAWLSDSGNAIVYAAYGELGRGGEGARSVATRWSMS